jgi:hypothetical protein
MAVEVISIDEVHARMKAQGVSAREHVAFRCPICGTVQSMASLLKAGAPADKLETYIGFSCEGRFSDAGPWPGRKASAARRKVRGCDWTLGGLFKIHKLEVEKDGKRQMVFEIATKDEAQELERLMNGAAGTQGS